MNDGAKHCLAEPSDKYAVQNCLDVPYVCPMDLLFQCT